MNFIIMILFNTKWPKLKNNTDPVWINYRLSLFEKYTLQSLLNQPDNNFTIWMICSKESKSLLYDKKYPQTKFLFGEKEVEKEINKYSTPAIVLKIDSDDCYHKDAIGITRGYLQQSKSISMVMYVNGYIYDIYNNELYEFSRHSLPNYATIFPKREDWTIENFKKYCWCDLTKVRREFRPIVDKNKRTLLLNHQKNLSKDPKRNNTFEINGRTGKGNLVTDLSILKNYGVNYE